MGATVRNRINGLEVGNIIKYVIGLSTGNIYLTRIVYSIGTPYKMSTIIVYGGFIIRLSVYQKINASSFGVVLIYFKG